MAKKALTSLGRRFACGGLALLAGALSAPIAPASANPLSEQILAQMSHAAWTARDGAPQAILALAQGVDGLSGIVRIDPKHWHPGQPSADRHPLPLCRSPGFRAFTRRDGSLWLVFLECLASLG